jgi:hypothetical protein
VTVSSDLGSYINWFVIFYPTALIEVLDETFVAQAKLLQNSWQILGFGMK